MEAEAKHDFAATAVDELSFRKGAVLMVINMEEDKNWFRAEFGGKEGLIPSNYIHLRPHTWYYSQMSRLSAEKLLGNKPQGSFLIRLSESSPGDFSLSVKCHLNGVQHFKVLRDEAGKFFLWVDKFNSLNELVNFHYSNSVSRLEDVKLRDLMLREFLVQALHDFFPQEVDELELRRGDIIVVTDKSDMNWWAGELGNKRGYFPAKYVAPFKS